MSEGVELFRHVAYLFKDRCAFGVVLLEALGIVNPKTRLMDRA